MIDLYYRYHVGSEAMMLGLCIIMVVLIVVTQPRVTTMYRITISGFLISGITIIVHQLMLFAAYDLKPLSLTLVNILFIVYCLLYSVTLLMIYGYIDLLSYRRRSTLVLFRTAMTVLGLGFLAVMVFPLFTGRLYVIGADGLQFTDWQYSINAAGILCAAVSFITTILRRKEVAKIVSWGLMIFAPTMMFALLLEPIWKKTSYTSYTSVLSFLLFYLLFHCTKYDDVVGCQDYDALNTQIQKAIKGNHKYILLHTYFPQLQKREFGDVRNKIDYASSEKCRKIERLMPGIRLYSNGIFSYFLFAVVKSDEDAAKIIDGVNSILREPISYDGRQYLLYSKQTVIRENSCLKSYKHVNSMVGFLREKFNSNAENEQVIASEKDYESFATYYEVLQALLDIRATGTIDDERVLCYIQPIHSIEHNSFRTGESLMRMNINGRMIFPDQFIGVAESNDCIHALTRIILNKVCKKIKYLEDNNYDFDAITVNCCTLELEDWNLHQELFDIISQNEIDPGHVRLEITESTTITNYSSILHNMKKLNERGISFYLDDFGTGYSNLERIINFPFHTIKFDKSILYNSLKNNKADEMMKMLVGFFDKNGLSTVVEGVEDKDQYEYCKAAGFDYIQGYLFSKPIPIDNIVEFFDKKMPLKS